MISIKVLGPGQDRSGGHIDPTGGKLPEMDTDPPGFEMGQEDMRAARGSCRS